MGRLVAIDPSLRGCGVAVFVDGRLRAGALVRTKRSGPDAWRDVSTDVALAAMRALGYTYCHAGEALNDLAVDELVVEFPQRDGRRVRMADLFTVAAVAGACVATIRSTTYRAPTVAEWKGSTPKEVTAARAREALSPDELAVADGMTAPESLQHNVWDAIALGLWALGRLPGASAKGQARTPHVSPNFARVRSARRRRV